MQKRPYGDAARNWPDNRLDEFANRLADGDADVRFDIAKAALANRYVDMDVQTALYFANAIVEPGPNDEDLIKFGEKLIQKDPEAARAWLPTSRLSEKAKAKILSKAPPPDSEG